MFAYTKSARVDIHGPLLSISVAKWSRVPGCSARGRWLETNKIQT